VQVRGGEARIPPALVDLSHYVSDNTRRVGDLNKQRTTLRRRQLGIALRELREEAGLTLEVAGPELDSSASTLSRIEKGQQGANVHLVKSMLDLYDIGGDRWTELIAMTRWARQRGWWRAYGLDDTGYVPLEAEATMVRDYTLGYVPGLLQTEDYALALFRASPMRRTESTLANEIKVRTIRQRRLTAEENPLALVAIVDESALRRPVGGPKVMQAQLARIIEAAALDRVTLQVLPVSTGAHPGLAAVFAILSFGQLGLPDMAYVEHPMGSVQLEKEDDVARAIMVFEQLRSLALSPADSVALVRRLAEQE
jgi:transcriptional regulator with XRE-family HTH domain